VRHAKVDTLWGATIHVYWDCEPEDCFKHLNRQTGFKLMAGSLGEQAESDGFCMADGANAMIWIATELTSAEAVGVLTHEAMHATLSILSHRDVGFPGGEEAYAYTIQYIVQEVLKASLK